MVDLLKIILGKNLNLIFYFFMNIFVSIQNMFVWRGDIFVDRVSLSSVSAVWVTFQMIKHLVHLDYGQFILGLSAHPSLLRRYNKIGQISLLQKHIVNLIINTR